MKTDRRVKYTKMVLKETLLELLEERPIERITVKELCDRADINRSTFYVHYGSPQELLDSICKELYMEIFQKKRDFSDIKEYMTQICDIMYENRQLLKVLIISGRAMSMINIADIWKEDFAKGMSWLGLSREELETVFLYIPCGAMAVVVSWLLGQIPMTRDQIVDHVLKITLGAIEKYSKEE